MVENVKSELNISQNLEDTKAYYNAVTRQVMSLSSKVKGLDESDPNAITELNSLGSEQKSFKISAQKMDNCFKKQEACILSATEVFKTLPEPENRSIVTRNFTIANSQQDSAFLASVTEEQKRCHNSINDLAKDIRNKKNTIAKIRKEKDKLIAQKRKEDQRKEAEARKAKIAEATAQQASQSEAKNETSGEEE